MKRVSYRSIDDGRCSHASRAHIKSVTLNRGVIDDMGFFKLIENTDQFV